MSLRTSFGGSGKLMENRIVRYLLICLGFASLAIGAIGIFVPLLPTTPFLLLSAAAFARSSERFHTWLITSPHFGPFIKNYREKKGITLRAKAVSLNFLWGTMIISALMVSKATVTLILIVIGLLVTLHLLSLRTLKNTL